MTSRAKKPEDGPARRQRIQRELTDPQGGVATLAQLREHGVTYDQVRAEVDAGRWHRVGRRTVSLTGPQPSGDEALWRWATWEVGSDACLDGVSALLAWGLKKWTEEVVHVSVGARSRYRRVDGVRALSEIDFAELGRARGWPEPHRQAVVHVERGRIYLDVRFTAYRTVVEVNGVQHYEALATMDDALRRNEHAIGDQTALEIPAVALVLDPEPFLDQVEASLRKGGWSPDLPSGRRRSARVRHRSAGERRHRPAEVKDV